MMKPRLGNPAAARLVACVLAVICAAPATAQYVWLDEKGVKQYSDMPPPASVPAGRILKQPGSFGIAAPPASESAAAPTLAERNADFKKRQQEAADKEKKAAEQARLAADKAKNCERTRDYMRTLESGERISYNDRNGEKSFLTDEQRAAEMRDARQTLADCNK
jgi:hypothetical protein